MNLYLNSGVLPIELYHFGLHNAFAFHRHQRSGKAKWHAHLKLGSLAGLVALFLGQQVDAVGVLATKPQLALLGDIHAAGRLDAVARFVFGRHHQFHFASFVQRGFAQQQAARIALAAADAAQLFGAGFVVVGVEAAHHALACGGGDAGSGFYFQRHTFLRFAAQIQRQRLELDFLAAGHPALGLDAGHQGRGPQRLRAA